MKAIQFNYEGGFYFPPIQYTRKNVELPEFQRFNITIEQKTMKTKQKVTFLNIYAYIKYFI